MSTISKFPLLKLPILCIEDILLQSHSFELINFSLLSKKCHRVVKSLRTPFEGLDIKVTNKGTLVIIGCGDKSKGNWYFNWYDFGKDEQIIRSVGGCKMKTCIKGMNFFSYVEENIQMSVKAGVEYLIDLFKLPIVRVHLHSDEIPQSRYPMLIGFSECEELKIKGENPMDHNELRNIIEQFKCTTLYLDIPIDESFYCDVIKSKRIMIEQGAEWVPWQQLFIHKFRKMTLFPCSLQPSVLQLFVMLWYHSTNTELEYIGLLFDKTIGKLNFKSLPLMPWSENRRSKCYKYRYDRAVDCSEGMDIQREDGLLATILVKPEFFFFCVWHARFHDATGLEID